MDVGIWRHYSLAPLLRVASASAGINFNSRDLSALHDSAPENGPGREQPLAARARALIVVEKLERSFPQLQDRHISRSTHVERTAALERREHARCINGRTRDYLFKRHTKHEELRHDVRKIDDPSGLRSDIPIRGDSIRPETLLCRSLYSRPVEVTRDPIAKIENDAAAARSCYVR